MADVQNNLIVIPGGMLKSHSIKVSAAQHRRIQRFSKNSGWTIEETVKRALSNFLHDEAFIYEGSIRQA